MTPNRSKRVERVEQAIAVRPLRRELVKEAFERFRETGELPEQQRLASAVVQRALKGPESEHHEPVDYMTALKRLVAVSQQMETGTLPAARHDEIRRHLYSEALSEEDVVRIPARQLLQLLADCGRDVTRPLYLDEELGLPEYGTVGLHVLGWPQCLVRPPYEEQARRLLHRLAQLRDRVEQGNETWLRSLGEAAFAFLTTGRLPKDGLMMDCVLVDGELYALMEAHAGRDNADLMAAYDQVATARGHRRATAIDNLTDLIWERQSHRSADQTVAFSAESSALP